MKFSAKIKETIQPWSLLDHSFYQAWSKGELKRTTLKEYSAQYQKHVDAFPRYISATHSVCVNPEDRRVLLENLNDEEGLSGKPHPLLWTQFAKAFGHTEETLSNTQACASVQKIIETFLSNGKKSYEEGLASFYSYESQVPEVAETKLTGLKEHYNIKSEAPLEFFEVHKKADLFHRKSCEDLLDLVPKPKQESALKAAESSAKALWDFLTEMQNFDSKAKAVQSA